MIDNETLLGYALNALEPAEQDAVRAKLKDDTASKVNLERIRKMLSPLEADREPPRPPGNLSSATLEKLDLALAQPKIRTSFFSSRWVELALAASIGMLGFGVVATAIGKLQADEQRAICQNNLRQVSGSLNEYANTHHDKYPHAGVDCATAGDFHKVLATGGTWPEKLKPTCFQAEPVGYAYSLGHRNGETLVGPSRDPEHSAHTPVVADFPSANAKLDGAVSPHGRGQNVLFADGAVKYMLMPTLNSDHIYLNDNKQPRAGLHAKDFVLGHPGDAP